MRTPGAARFALAPGYYISRLQRTKKMKPRNNEPIAFAVCINNEDYFVSLELHKIYRVFPDKDAARHGAIRVVDESGEDYLYEADRFVPIDVTARLRNSLLKTT